MATLINDNELNSVSGGAGSVTKAFVYTVKRGDCLSKIASAYGTTVSAIMSINNNPNSAYYIQNEDRIREGQQILVPTR